MRRTGNSLSLAATFTAACGAGGITYLSVLIVVPVVGVRGDLKNSFRGGGRLFLQLQAMERGIASALAQQLVVAARLGHRAVLDHQNAVRMHDGGKPMRDYQRGAALAQFGDRIPDVTLGLGVERRGCLVQKYDRRIL